MHGGSKAHDSIELASNWKKADVDIIELPSLPVKREVRGSTTEFLGDSIFDFDSGRGRCEIAGSGTSDLVESSKLLGCPVH